MLSSCILWTAPAKVSTIKNGRKCFRQSCTPGYNKTLEFVSDIYHEMLEKSWKQANLIVAMYDVTRETTFGSVTKVRYLFLCGF